MMSEKKRSSKPPPGCRDSPGGNCSCCTAATGRCRRAELQPRPFQQLRCRSAPLCLNGCLDIFDVLRSALQFVLMRQRGENGADGLCVTRSESWLMGWRVVGVAGTPIAGCCAYNNS